MFTEDGILMMFLSLCVGTADNVIEDKGSIRIAEGLEKNTSLMALHFALDGMFPPGLLLHPMILSH
jgi:hypothetical protein